MKKFYSIATVVMLAAGAFAQDGTVQFGNGVTTAFYFYDASILRSNLVTSATLGSQTGTSSTGVLDVGLFWSTSLFNTVNGGTLAGIENIGSAYPGQLAANYSFPIAGTAPGETVFMQCFAWDGSYGDSAAGLQACLIDGGLFGATTAGDANTVYGAIGSAIEVTLGAPSPAPGSVIFDTATGYFGKTVVLATPEPGTLALGALGAAALLLFGRRK